MSKLSYIYRIITIHACILFGLIISEDLFRAEDYRLNVYGDKKYDSSWYHIYGKRETAYVSLNNYGGERSIIVYRLHFSENILKKGKYGTDLWFRIQNFKDKSSYVTENLHPREYNHANNQYNRTKKELTCNLYKCHVGLLYHCPTNKDLCSNPANIKNFFYIGFVKAYEFDELVLKLVPKSSTNKNIFSIVVCPIPKWLPQFSNSEYIETSKNNIYRAPFKGNPQKIHNLKLLYCHGSDKLFVKCGHLKQMFMPSIDVGYQCAEYNKKEANNIINAKEGTNWLSISTPELMCNDTLIHDFSKIFIALLPHEHNYDNVNKIKIGHIQNNTNLYAGHRLHCLDVSDFYGDKQWEYEKYTGYSINYEPKCKVPYLNATLRLKINGIIQEFENKIDHNIGKIGTYIVDRREIKNASVGCHAVPDETKHPAFSDFYELFHSTSLLMFDEKKEKHIKVDRVQNLVSNRVYKCALIIKGNNSKIEKPDYIKETEFSINIIYENAYNSTDPIISNVSNSSIGSNTSTISSNSVGSNTSSVADGSSKTSNSTDSDNSKLWIIFGISIVITILLIIVLVIIKKLQGKRKKSKKDMSTSSSTSSSQQTAKSLTAVSKVPNTVIVNKKIANRGSRNMEKTMSTENLEKKNEITTSKQSVDSADSNLVYWAKNDKIKLVAK